MIVGYLQTLKHLQASTLYGRFMWLRQLPVMIPVCIILVLIDTGGIHWFLGVMIYQLFHQVYELLVQKKGG